MILKAYASLDVGQIHYRYVEGDSRTPLVLFHRAPASSESFEPMMVEMAGDRPLFALDTPGFGGSFDPKGDLELDQLAEWFSAALDTIGVEEMHIFGDHTGTHFASALAIQQPDRVKSVILNGLTYWSKSTARDVAESLPPKVERSQSGSHLIEIWDRISNMFPHYDERLVDLEFRSCLRAFKTLPRAEDMVISTDFPALFDQIECPILALCAENEFLRPWFQAALDARPDAQSKILGPVQYFVPELDTANVVETVRRFIEQIEAD